MEKIEKVIKEIKDPDQAVMKKTQERLDRLTKPQGSLGRLEELAKQVAGVTRKAMPKIKDKAIFTLAADHGVAVEGVSAFPQEVTQQMVLNFLAGGAGINVLARQAQARVVIVDMGVAGDLPAHVNLVNKKINHGTKNMSQQAAMTREEAIQSINAGIDVFEKEVKKGLDLIGTGDMGIGNTTASTALAAVFTSKAVEELTGQGTGIKQEGLARKISVIKASLNLTKPHKNDPIDVLSKVGGFEHGGLCGIILSAATHNVPIVIDGFISGSAALLASALAPKVKHYLIASHVSAERGHAMILKALGIEPLLNLNLRLGEGTGAALSMPLIEASIKILTEMATFQNANVSNKINEKG